MRKSTIAPGQFLRSVHMEKSYLGKAGYPVLYKVLGQTPPGQKPPGHKPLDKNPLDKNPPCQKPAGQKPPRQNILFKNFITFVFRMSYGKEISIWF